MAQNIYDDPTFFASYIALRQNPNSANEMLEKPALFSLAPDLGGKRVLDLGCGCGENCADFFRRGAASVTGVDISERMLAVARSEQPDAVFLRADMEALPAFAQPFDVVFSSLAVHYVKDFPKLCAAVYSLLTPGGAFVFSQENPLTTAPSADEVWTRDENGGYLHYNLAAYSTGGRRTIHWFVDGVVKYHRTFSDVVNALAQAGFVITAMREPIPSEADLERDPTLARKLHKPDFLLVQAKKPVSLGF